MSDQGEYTALRGEPLEFIFNECFSYIGGDLIEGRTAMMIWLCHINVKLQTLWRNALNIIIMNLFNELTIMFLKDGYQ